MKIHVREFKDRLLNEQRADAARRLADQDYWGDTGLWVNRAVAAISGAIDGAPLPPDGEFNKWAAALDDAIARAHEEFRASEDDPDGYGSATFHEVRRLLADILES